MPFIGNDTFNAIVIPHVENGGGSRMLCGFLVDSSPARKNLNAPGAGEGGKGPVPDVVQVQGMIHA